MRQTSGAVEPLELALGHLMADEIRVRPRRRRRTLVVIVRASHLPPLFRSILSLSRRNAGTHRLAWIPAFAGKAREMSMSQTRSLGFFGR